MDDDLLTLDQAAALYDVGVATLRRRAHFGEIEGAVKLRGKRGQEWRVPGRSVEALGYEQRQTPEGEPGLTDLVVVIRRLTEALAESQRENARLNRELGGAVAEAAALRRQLDAEQRLRGLTPPSRREVDLREAPATARPRR